jgi:glycerol uptake facilitator-like aquaporin
MLKAKIINNISGAAEKSYSRRALNNNNNMKREFVFPLVVGIILGVLVMIFWQLNARLNDARNLLVQLEQATAQNTKNVSDVITFINNATGANQPKTPAATETPKE